MRVRRSLSSVGSTAYGARERRRRGAALALAVGAGRVIVSGAAAHAGTPACVRHAARRRPQPERVADRVGELRAVQGVEVKLAHAMAGELLHLLDRNAGGDHAPGVVVVLEPGETLVQPGRDAGAAARARSAAPAGSA